MINIILVTAKYIIIILFAVYALQSFLALGNKSEKLKSKLYNSQVAIIFIIHLLGFISIFMNNISSVVIIFYGTQLIYLILLLGITYIFFEKRTNRALLNNMVILITIGLIMLTRLSFDDAVRQFEIIVLGSAIFFVFLFFYRVLKKVWAHLTWIYCIFGIFLLLCVIVFAKETYGAKISIDFGIFSVQPLEFVKILYVLFIASILSKSLEFKNLILSCVLAAVHVIILVLSNDLGGALIFFLVYVFMLFLFTGKLLYFLGGIISGSVAAFLSYFIFDHVQVRVGAWLNPWPLIDSQGYQITQSLFAIGTGGFMGSGLFNGMPEKIPVVKEDFIFSAISEELGGFFAICLILVCLSTFLIFIKIAISQKDYLFGKFVVMGLAVTYSVQIFLTIGGAIKLIPSTGVTLPFISYGGSSIIASLIMFSIVQANYIYESKEVINEEKK